MKTVGRFWRKVIVMGSLMTMALLGFVASSTPAWADPTFATMNAAGGIYWRSAPDWNTPIARAGFGVYPGTTISVRCFQRGSAVPGSANTMWVQASWVAGPGTGSGWINEHFVNDGAAINQPPPGVPACGASAPAPAPVASTPSGSTPAAWVGSPFAGAWPNADGCNGAAFPSASCSLPNVHWWLANAPQGNWAADLQGVGPGTPVVLYVAPQNPSTPITTTVAAVSPACRSGRVSDGGYLVTVAISSGSTRLGTVTYAHVNPTVRVGQTIGRWGTQVGTVGSGYDRSAGCWGGPHVHFQAMNAQGFSCYNRGWNPGQRMNPTNFIGFVGGNYVNGARQACP
jgi:hypothetical protein